MTESEGENRKGVVWLNAWRDPVANLKAYSSHIELADLHADGEYKLVVADLDKKLKIFKGTSIMMEHALLEQPVGLCCYYMDVLSPPTPVIAVAAGPHIFIYKNLKPFYKFTLPSPHVEAQELEIWSDLKSDKIDLAKARELLKAMKDKGLPISTRSLDLLVIHEPTLLQDFANTYKNMPLVSQTVITTMTTIKKSRDDRTAVSCLVVGTESGQVMVLDPSANSILKKVLLKSVPAFIISHGVYDVEYRLTVACRNGNLYTIKNGDLSGMAIELEVQPVGLVRIDKHIFVGCMDQSIHAFQLRGKKDYTLYMPCGITNMELLHNDTTNIKGLLVALESGDIRVYYEKNLVSTVIMPSPLTALRFGHFGREGGSMVMVTNTGAVDVKILSRNSISLNSAPALNGPPPEQEIPLKVPKKTKLYVEQTQRERETAVDMHRVFQRELYKLRLNSARSYVKSLTENQGPISHSVGSNLRLSAQVQGLGPVFKLKLTIENTGKRPIPDTTITFRYNRILYAIKQQVINIPLLVPELSYKAETQVQSQVEGGAEPIRILVCNSQSTVPVVTAIINMPVPESFFSI